MVVHLRHGSHVGTVHFAFFNVATGRNNRRLHNRLACHRGTAHQDRALHFGTGMNRDTLLHIRIFKNHGIVDVARFFERRKHHGVTDFFGTLDTGVRTNPAVTNNVRVANDGTLAYNTERERHFFAVGLQLLFKRSDNFGISLVEELEVDEVRADFGKHENTASAHLVTHMHRVSDHVADLSAADNGTHVLQHRGATHQNAAEHRDTVHQRVFDDAVMHKAIVNARREGHIARQKERTKKAGQIDRAHKGRSENAVRVKIGFHHDLVPGFGTVAVLFENLDFGFGQRTVFGCSRENSLEIFDGSCQNTVLKHFFQF